MLVDTLSQYNFIIRAQLEKQYQTELTQNREKELEHRKEILRILSTHQIPQQSTISENHQNVLIQGYKDENERLYSRTKGMLSKLYYRARCLSTTFFFEFFHSGSSYIIHFKRFI